MSPYLRAMEAPRHDQGCDRLTVRCPCVWLALPLLSQMLFVLRQACCCAAPFPPLILTARPDRLPLDIPTAGYGRGVPRLAGACPGASACGWLAVLVSLVLVPRLVDQAGRSAQALPRWLVSR